ncbi:hypothetical protein D3C80_2133640 [compost metagenome]
MVDPVHGSPVALAHQDGLILARHRRVAVAVADSDVGEVDRDACCFGLRNSVQAVGGVDGLESHYLASPFTSLNTAGKKY